MQLFLLLMSVTLSAQACKTPGQGLISRQEAIEIARKEISFEPKSVETAQSTFDGVPAWEVMLRNTSEPDPRGSVVFVTIDARSGKILALARN
ncbi:MAG: PepSY domain-containing protein [Xanthomonadales bacterium]|nr:PepSY domain-containing protein [Xanthomonadales bacterium]